MKDGLRRVIAMRQATRAGRGRTAVASLVAAGASIFGWTPGRELRSPTTWTTRGAVTSAAAALG
jgi:hypothetical protein